MYGWQKEIKEKSFIDDKLIENYLNETENITETKFNAVLEKSKSGERLELEEVSILLNSNSKERIEKIFKTAEDIKTRVYGNRVVLFAPLYLGNKCINNCTYCGFRVSNIDVNRKSLNENEIISEIKSLEKSGHKRLILVFGTHNDYTAHKISETVKQVYNIKFENGEIRRVNINAAPFKVEEFREIKESGIGTYQIFQETYHQKTYQKVHPSGEKANFKWRLFGLDRAQKAGIDDVGIGALFGLYDWKFEVMGLVSHAIHLENTFGVGPHTISFPRLNEAKGQDISDKYLVTDDQLKRIIAILRLAVPYTGLILTARETPKFRAECMKLGVSQIDAGTQIELNGYTLSDEKQDLCKEQFKIGDSRSLDDILCELMEKGFVPSFCTACYRLGRTGEHFMEFSKPGFIHNFCTPNALLTLKEYLEDYGSKRAQKIGANLIKHELENAKLGDEVKKSIKTKLQETKDGKRDLYY